MTGAPSAVAAGLRLVMRSDATPAIGTGHLLRMLALGQAWQDAGGRVVAVVAEAPGSLVDRLADEGFDVRTVPAPHPDRADAATLAELGRQTDTRLAIDGPRFDATYLDRLGVAVERSLVMDDVAERPRYPVGLVVNQNAHADPAAYPPGTRLLGGLEFVLLRREFRHWQQARPPVRGTVRRLLVTFGGADPQALTRRTVDAIVADGLHREIDVEVVVGAANPDARQLVDEATGAGMTAVLAADRMAERMARADLCLTSGGTTVWELARMGLPSLVVEAGPLEPSLVRGLRHVGLFAPLGPAERLDGRTIVRAVRAASADRAWRSTMADLGPRLVDGRGADRVAAALAGLGRSGGEVDRMDDR